MPRVAVLGGGTLGAAFARHLRALDPETPWTHRRAGPGVQRLDYAAPDLAALELRGARVALLLGGVTRIAACEDDPEGSHAVNVTGTLALVAGLLERGVRPVAFSSDYVFAGDAGPYAPDAPRAPSTAYGRQKAELEARLAADYPEALVVRLGKVYGTTRGDGTLLDGFAQAWARGEVVRAATDQLMVPIHLEDVLREVLARLDARGVLHVCGRESASRYDLAEGLRVALGLDPARLEAIRLGELFPERPLDTRLVSDVAPRWTLAQATAAVAANYRDG
ncbi:MAG: sugar nucleotide-binding protein [Planctomycetota bacterium]